MSQIAAPVAEGDRIHILDILRGFAIFGILVVNIGGFATPMFLPGAPELLSAPDVVARSIVAFLAEGKFYSIFSFLFGLGFAVQIARAEAKGRDVRGFYPRRLLALLGIGVVHATLLWTGEILRIYALLGFVLYAFRRRSTRTLLLVAAGFSLVGLGMALHFGGPSGNGETLLGIDFVSEARAAYGSPSYLPVLAFQGALLIPSFLLIGLVQGPNSLALFLLGMAAGRSGVFEKIEHHGRFWRRILAIGLAAGLVLSIPMMLPDREVAESLAFVIGAPLLASGYVGLLCLLSLRPRAARLLAPLSNVGRMALTHYVLQSLVCSFLFSGWGLGFYEKVSFAWLMPVVFAIFAVQVPLSRLWLSRFHFGPLEWAWRWVTYGRRPPFVR